MTTSLATNTFCPNAQFSPIRAPLVRPLQEWHRMLEGAGAGATAGREGAPA